MIRCEGLTFSYPDGTRALDGLDLEIRAGERVAITGRNGSGKSTLAGHWNGLLRPSAGRVLVDGAPTEGRRVAELARIVGLAFQDPGSQIFSRTCRAEVAFGPRNLGLRGARLDESVEAPLAAVGLTEAGSTNPYDLGPARRKLLAIAAVLAMGTPVLVIDEPTAGQDARGLARLREIVSNVAAEGRTVVAITHDRRFIADSFPRVVVLDAGRVIADGPPPATIGGVTGSAVVGAPANQLGTLGDR
jgi:energy-coupling factor transporter ATP-binding protein EcfA2